MPRKREEIKVVLPQTCLMLMEQVERGDITAFRAIKQDIVDEVVLSYQLDTGDAFTRKRNQSAGWVELLYLANKPGIVQRLLSDSLLNECTERFVGEVLVKTIMEHQDWLSLEKCLTHLPEDPRYESFAWRTFAQELFGRHSVTHDPSKTTLDEHFDGPLSSASRAIDSLENNLTGVSVRKKRETLHVLKVLPNVLTRLWSMKEEEGQPHFVFLEKHIKWASSPEAWVGAADELTFAMPGKSVELWNSMLSFADKAGCRAAVEEEWIRHIDEHEKFAIEQINSQMGEQKGGNAMKWVSCLMTLRESQDFLPKPVLKKTGELVKSVLELEINLLLAQEGKVECALSPQNQKKVRTELEKYKALRLPGIDWDHEWAEVMDERDLEERSVMKWRVMSAKGVQVSKRLRAL